MSFGHLHVLLTVVVVVVVSELPQTTVATNERQVNGLNLVSSLHMPRRKHQEHGSLKRVIQVLGANTIENKDQHGALRPLW